MQWIFKVGNKKPSIDIAVRISYWTDCQLIDIRPTGFYPASSTKSFCIIEDGKDYWKVRGSTNWKSTIQKVYNLKKWLCVADASGRYPWDAGYNEETRPKRVRDWFLDYKYLLDQNIIDKSSFDRIYDKSREQIIYTDRDVTQYLFHEDEKTRLPSDYSNISGSIASGTYKIGTGVGKHYDTWTLFEADIAAQLTGNLTGEGQNEQTDISTVVTFDTDTNTHLLKLTAESGAEHNGGAYGNGARINFGTSDQLRFDETNAGDLANIEISKLALDASGFSNSAIVLADCGDSGLSTINRMLVKGDSNTSWGVYIYSLCVNSKVINNIVYGIGGNATEGGIRLYNVGAGDTHYVCNNTCIKCRSNFIQANAAMGGTITFKNNFAQGDTGGNDFEDAGGGFGTTAKNISEDATSPDAAYRSKDVHTNSVFKNYGADDYRLNSGGDATNLAIVDDGDNLFADVPKDIEGQDRTDGTPFWIGASHIVAVGGLSIPIAMHHYKIQGQ